MSKGGKTTTYRPLSPPPDGTQEYSFREFQTLASWFTQPSLSEMNFEVLNSEPPKPRAGMLVCASTEWQASFGLYLYDGSTWNKL